VVATGKVEEWSKATSGQAREFMAAMYAGLSPAELTTVASGVVVLALIGAMAAGRAPVPLVGIVLALLSLVASMYQPTVQATALDTNTAGQSRGAARCQAVRM
jgi:hypothetical protein